MNKKACKLRQVLGGAWQRVFFLLALFLLGCGGPGYRLVSVSGTVTMDGNPVGGASVTFLPIGSGVGPASAAVTNSEGHFKLKTIDNDLSGAVPGTHRVMITTARASSGDERAKVSKEIVPPQYRDGSFQLEITEDGTDAANIDMQTDRKIKRSR